MNRGKGEKRRFPAVFKRGKRGEMGVVGGVVFWAFLGVFLWYFFRFFGGFLGSFGRVAASPLSVGKRAVFALFLRFFIVFSAFGGDFPPLFSFFNTFIHFFLFLPASAGNSPLFFFNYFIPF